MDVKLIIIFFIVAFLAGMVFMWILLYPHRELKRYRGLEREWARRTQELKRLNERW